MHAVAITAQQPVAATPPDEVAEVVPAMAATLATITR
jgi:hypothetical protein